LFETNPHAEAISDQIVVAVRFDWAEAIRTRGCRFPLDDPSHPRGKQRLPNLQGVTEDSLGDQQITEDE
jgi:hypothetical protein